MVSYNVAVGVIDRREGGGGTFTSANFDEMFKYL